MPFEIVRNDITLMQVDAIVNAAKKSLLGGGGVDGCIHRAAGPELLAECRTLGGCDTGDAKITKAYKLPAKYIIHTVGPVWQGGGCGEEKLLRSCYRASLALAKEYGCETVAFPLISAGVFGYPKPQALKVAVDEITSFLLENDMTVYLVVYNRQAFEISGKLFSEVREYIDEHYIEEHPDYRRSRMLGNVYHADEVACAPHAMALDEDELAQRLKALDEGFSKSLLNLIDEKGLTDAQCYKRANISRQHFSKIRNNPDYKPTKPTALALAVALELNLAETRALLEKAGYALTHTSKFDIILEYCIRNKHYNIFEINEVLFAYDQPLLGA